MKYSTESFPPEDHIVINRDGPDAITLQIHETGGMSIVRWYNCLDMSGNPSDHWRVDPSSGMSLSKQEVPKFMQIMYENRSKFSDT